MVTVKMSHLSRVGLIFLGLALGTLSTLSKTPNNNFDITRRIVVFIYKKDVQGRESPEGTGFLVAVPLKSNPQRNYLVLVTARHIADPGWIGCPVSSLVAKFNKKMFDPQKDTSGTTEFDLGSQHWLYPDDDSVDTAYTFLSAKKFDELELRYRTCLLRRRSPP
jgi:hypothetical protein